jgi:hypothetical protein
VTEQNTDPPPSDTSDTSDTFDEIREAAGAVVASLKRLVEATERVVEDPDAFSRVVDSGRSAVEAFAGGFAAQAAPRADGDDEATAQGGDSSGESSADGL